MLAYIIIFGLLALSNSATFLLDNEGWTIAGNKRTTEAKHQSYSLVGSKMSNYILGTDDLVNVDARNRDDKNLWYFRSPPITLVKKPFLMVFTITSFSGDFTKLNAGAPLVKITDADNLIIVFDGAQAFDGKITTMNVPFNKNIWSSKTDFSFEKIFQKPFVVEILGDWTRGIETVAIDNVEFYYS
jgi:hypothetical protein